MVFSALLSSVFEASEDNDMRKNARVGFLRAAKRHEWHTITPLLSSSCSISGPFRRAEGRVMVLKNGISFATRRSLGNILLKIVFISFAHCIF